jgi:hypothetical protein
MCCDHAVAATLVFRTLCDAPGPIPLAYFALFAQGQWGKEPISAISLTTSFPIALARSIDIDVGWSNVSSKGRITLRVHVTKSLRSHCGGVPSYEQPQFDDSHGPCVDFVGVEQRRLEQFGVGVHVLISARTPTYRTRRLRKSIRMLRRTSKISLLWKNDGPSSRRKNT